MFLHTHAALVAAALFGSGHYAEGFECRRPAPPSMRKTEVRIPLRGRPLVTDSASIPESIPISDLQWFPEAWTCDNQAEDNTPESVASVLGHVLGQGGDVDTGSETSRVGPGSVFQSSGAILLRGLPLVHPSDVSAAIQLLNATLIPYVGGVAPRQEVSTGVLQASVEPPDVTIEPHWEMSYAPSFPHVLFFFCRKIPEVTGEGLTPITDGRAVLRDLEHLGIAQEFRERGVLYRFYYPSISDGGSVFTTFVWEVAFKTNNTQDVDEFLGLKRMDFPSLEWSWLPSKQAGAPHSLEYTLRKDALAPHPHVPGESVWFNQITAMHKSYFHSHSTFPTLLHVPVPYEEKISDECTQRYPFDTAYGDGAMISEETIRTIRQVQWNHTAVFQWEPGDLLVLDNSVAAHGRMGYDQRMGREMFVSLIKV